ncbi:MAG: hypothetical protein J3K34DRAFT_485533 [Monoraphidium minutum]|nr:MAG: hypothetical protein J3K34DRAFT_485533 [Monoraphidium minutum]
MTGPAAPPAPAQQQQASAPPRPAGVLSEEMRRVIYGEVTAEEKDKAYQGSLQRWWQEYAGRKNEEEDMVADSLMYDERWAWAADVARCLPDLELCLPAAGRGGCCRRHVAQQRGAAVATVALRFSGAASLTLRASRDGSGGVSAPPARPPPLQAPQAARGLTLEQQQQQQQQQQQDQEPLSLDQLAALPRLRELSLVLEYGGGGNGGERGGWGGGEAAVPCWSCALERRAAAAGAGAGAGAGAAAHGSSGAGAARCEVAPARVRPEGGALAWGPCGHGAQPLFSGGLDALTRLTSLRLIGAGVYAPRGAGAEPAPPAPDSQGSAPAPPALRGPGGAGGSGSSRAAGGRGAGGRGDGGAACSPLAVELSRLPLRHFETDQIELLARPAGDASNLGALQSLRSLRLRVPFLSRRTLWLEVAALAGLSELRVDVARCAPGSSFHLRDALAPLTCLPGLRDLRLDGFDSLCDRDLALAAHLRHLTALHLRLEPTPFHAEHTAPGGGAAAAAAGAAALARGLPALASLGLAGCRVSRDALLLLAAALRGLRELDLSGTPEADDALLVPAAPSLSALTALRLARCGGVSDASLAALAAACRELCELDLSGPKPAITDRGAAALAGLPRLRSLSLDGAARLTAAGVAALLREPPPAATAGAPAAAGGAPIAAAALGTLPPPPPLEVLGLAGCPAISDAALTALGAALPATLRALRLDGCGLVTNRGLRRLLPLLELRELSLRGTLVQPQGPTWRALAARLQRLSCDPEAGVHFVGLE